MHLLASEHVMTLHSTLQQAKVSSTTRSPNYLPNNVSLQLVYDKLDKASSRQTSKLLLTSIEWKNSF